MTVRRMVLGVWMTLVAAALVAPAIAAEGVTVGDFLARIALAKQLPAASGADALESLRSAGVSLPALDVRATLTEGAVAQIATALGLKVKTSSPQAPFTHSQMSAFVSMFGSEIGVGSKAPNPGSSFGDTLKKKKKKKTKPCPYEDD